MANIYRDMAFLFVGLLASLVLLGLTVTAWERLEEAGRRKQETQAVILFLGFCFCAVLSLGIVSITLAALVAVVVDAWALFF